MTSREKAMAIFEHKSNGEGVIWTGHLSDETIPLFAEAYGVAPTREAIATYLDDDCRFILADEAYHHPDGAPMFDFAWGMEKRAETLSAEGCFAHAESPEELKDYPWPDVKYFDFTEIYKEIDKYPDKMIFTGLANTFFHKVCDFLGMENYFIQMYENPELVGALTERIVDFYVEANDKFFEGLGNRADVMFIANDFGTQRDMIISPELFHRFVFPSMKRLIAVGKKHNKKVMLHSCGSIYRIIPDLIDAGVDILHPIQAQAAGMSADEIKQYKNDLAFVGGIDAQSFFVNATPEEVRREVHRVKSILGPDIVISPSHEEVLPNVPPANILAMAEAGKEF